MQQRIHKLQSFPGTPQHQEMLTERIAEFGKIMGMHDLTERSLRTDERLAEQFNKWVGEASTNEFRGMLDALEALNHDQISAIRFNRNDNQDVYNVVHGIVSGFNADDINYYINNYYDSSQEADRSRMQRAILSAIPCSHSPTVGWIASMPTLKKIEEQLKAMATTTHGVARPTTIPPISRQL
jgi:hypothetical protein